MVQGRHKGGTRWHQVVPAGTRVVEGRNEGGTRVVQAYRAAPATRSLSTQHRFTRLLPQSISNHAVAYNITIVQPYEIPWSGRARGRCARDHRAAPANEITLNKAPVHARHLTEHLKSCSRAYSTTMASNIEYLGVAVVGSAVLGTTVLHPQTRSRSTQPSFTRLIPQSISNHAVA